jgi:ATP-dependent DNA helicase RecG
MAGQLSMKIPLDAEILALLEELERKTAGDLESEVLDFKPWQDVKDSKKVAVEYAACLANTSGGVIVFGVKDNVRGRATAIHGVGNYDPDDWRKTIFSSTTPNIAVELSELAVPEGTGRILVVRVPNGTQPPYGTSGGIFKRRVGKNCMPMDPHAFQRHRISLGAVDWSGLPAAGLRSDDLDAVEIQRARQFLARANPQSELLNLERREFLQGIGAVRNNEVTGAGLLLFGPDAMLRELCPQHQVQYILQSSPVDVTRNDFLTGGLLSIVERIEHAFEGPTNPEQELSLGLLKLRIPAFPLEVVREAVLNALTHRDYSNADHVRIRQSQQELVVTSPGGFLNSITPQNILRIEPVSRNNTLAQAFVRLRLVESAGIGRRRIFETTLRYGKRLPVYETDGHRVTLRVFDGGFDARMATLVAKWDGEGRRIDLDGLLVLSFLRENRFIDTLSASDLLQLPRPDARAVLDRLAQTNGILERKGKTLAATYHLAKGVAKDLLGKAAYTKVRGLDPIRYQEMVKAFLEDHQQITPRECRELLGLGESASAQVEVSRYLRQWSGESGFLERRGSGPSTHYVAREKLSSRS